MGIHWQALPLLSQSYHACATRRLVFAFADAESHECVHSSFIAVPMIVQF